MKINNNSFFVSENFCAAHSGKISAWLTAAVSAFFCAVLSACAEASQMNANPQNLQELADRAAASSSKKLLLEKGRYQLFAPLKLSQKHSGLEISSKSGNPADVVISGGKPIKNWRLFKDGIWTAKTDAEQIELITVNGKRANMACDGEYIFVVPDIGAHAGNSFFVRNVDVADLLKMGETERAQIVLDMFIAWSTFRVAIDKIEPDKNRSGFSKITLKGKPFFMRHNYYPRFQILNSMCALKKAGEFVFDKQAKSVYYIPREGENMRTAEVYYPIIDNAVIVEGSVESPAEKITISGVTFSDGGRMRSADGSFGSHGQGDSFSDSFVRADFARNFRIENCVFENTDQYCVWLRNGVWDSFVVGCEMRSVNGGIRVGNPQTKRSKSSRSDERADGISTGNIKISNNIIYNYGRWAKSAMGVSVHDNPFVEVEHNDIFDGYYTGVSLGWTWGYGNTNTRGNKINFNRIGHIGYGHTSDMGGIYTLGANPDSEIIGNDIFDIDCHLYGGWGVYSDEGSRYFKIRGNRTNNTSNGGYNMHYGRDILVEGNVFKFDKTAAIGFQRQEADSLTFRNNLVVYSSPVRLFRNAVPAPVNGKFYGNIYCNTNGEVKFGTLDLAQWQNSGQGKGSVICKVDDPRAVAFDKSVDTTKAGTFGEMRKRVEKILSNYKFPEVVNSVKRPDFEYGVFEDFSDANVNRRPDEMNVGRNNTSCKFVREGGVTAFKLALDQKGTARGSGSLNLKGGGVFRAEFETKLEDGSSFDFLLERSRILHVEKRKLSVGAKGEKVELPAGCWLKVNLAVKSGAKEALAQITDVSGKVVFDGKLVFGTPLNKVARFVLQSKKPAESSLFTKFKIYKTQK